MHSSTSNMDLELIAALIDGRLTEEDRARAMKLLAESNEALELYAQVSRERHEAAGAEVVPIAPRRGWRQWKVAVPVLAAAGLAIVAVPTLRKGGPSPATARAYAMELGRDAGFVSGLPNGWEQRGWAVTRGAGSSGVSSGPGQLGGPAESALAFRLGVRSVDLQIALQRGDTALAGRLIGDMVETLGSIALSGSVATRYAALRSALSTDTRDRAIDRASGAERQLRPLLGSSFEFGEWVAAAELAARTHDASFFRSAYGTRTAQSLDSLSEEQRQMLRSVDARVREASTDRMFEDVDQILQRIIQRSGS